MKTVVWQDASRVGDIGEQAGDLTLEAVAESSEQCGPVDSGQQGPSHPIVLDDISIKRVTGADGVGDGRQVRPCPVEFACVRSNV
jgi:hypothetical protein